MAKRQDYEVRSTYEGSITGRCQLLNHTRGEAAKFTRDHSRSWPSRVVHLLTGNFPLESFQAGERIRLRADLIGEVGFGTPDRLEYPTDAQTPQCKTPKQFKVVVKEIFERVFLIDADSEASAKQAFENATICDLEELGEQGGELTARQVYHVIPA